MQVVLDTNIIVSAVISPKGKPSQIVWRVLEGIDQICYDDRIFDEYDEVLHRPKLRLDPNLIAEFLEFIKKYGVRVTVPPLNVPFTDESDKKFYEVAKHCNAVLITGNLKHFPDDSKVVKSVNDL